MPEHFIIGLPRAMHRRMEGRARRAGQRISAILADKGKEATPHLLPFPNDAIHSLRAYMDREDDPRILVLPYAPIPKEVMDELGTMVELKMGSVCVIGADAKLWPRRDPKAGFDQSFLDSLYISLSTHLFGAEVLLPSAHLRQLGDGCERLLISANAVEESDGVAHHRYDFIKKCGDVLLHVCKNDGNVGTLFEFFASHGLDYARTGGITTTLHVVNSNGITIALQDSNDHLKQGDHTTPQAAARVYFHTFNHEGTFYVAIVYAGPHPKGNLTIRLELPPRT